MVLYLASGSRKVGRYCRLSLSEGMVSSRWLSNVTVQRDSPTWLSNVIVQRDAVVFQVFTYLDVIFCRIPDLKCCSIFAGCLSSHRSLFSSSFLKFIFICYCCWARRPGVIVLLLVPCWSLSAYRWAPPPTTRNITQENTSEQRLYSWTEVSRPNCQCKARF